MIINVSALMFSLLVYYTCVTSTQNIGLKWPPLISYSLLSLEGLIKYQYSMIK